MTRSRLSVTALEDRTVPAVTATLNGTTLEIVGTQYDDTVELRVVGTPPRPGDNSPPDPADQVRVWANNAYVGQPIDYERVRHGKVTFTGGTGNDNFRVTRDTPASDATLYIPIEASGNAGDDTLAGSEGNDILLGDDRTAAQVFDDKLYGHGGDDELKGLHGGDELHGGEGHDHLWGYMNVGSDSIEGHRDAEKGDKLYGGGGWDRIEAQYGNDLVHGGDGNDTVYGGYGDDMIRGHGGDDYLLGHAGNDTVIGDGGLDRVCGDGPPNVVQASDGNDYLDGGWDGLRDEVYGGGGADTFVRNPRVGTPFGSEDWFIDFTSGTDATRNGPILYLW